VLGLAIRRGGRRPAPLALLLPQAPLVPLVPLFRLVPPFRLASSL
jgi:hypothetical protein